MMHAKFAPGTPVVIATIVVGVCLQAMLATAKPPEWVPPELMDMIADDKARCMKEWGTTEDLIERASNAEPITDRSLTCYVLCLLEAFSLSDEEGNIDTDMMLGILPEHFQEKAKAVMAKCVGVTGDDPCDRMFNMGVCVQQQVPELWFVV